MSPDGPGGYRRRRRGRGMAGGPDQAGGAPPAAAGLAGAGLGEQKRLLIETALLTALIEESGHGYALIDRVQQLVGDQTYADAGSVYKVLRLLEEAGMVRSSWEPGAAGPQRRIYRVEPPGRELLQSRADALAQRGNALLGLSGLAKEKLAGDNR